MKIAISPRLKLTVYARALRLPFISVSVLAFIFGSLIETAVFNFINFLLGLAAVIGTHLGANLINDYADSKSGVDWQDKNSYNFFGGSKLIQEGVLSELFYLRTAIFCFLLAFLSVLLLSLRISDVKVVVYYSIILFLGWSYSHKPFQFSYHKLGEVIIFILFGQALVMGAYFIQTGIFPDAKSFMLSLPFGILTMTVLFVNEIPDYPQDFRCSKINWVSFLGPENSYMLYGILLIIAFLSIVIDIKLNYLGTFAYFSLVLIFPAQKALRILKNYSSKHELVRSSQLTIMLHSLASIILIIGILI